MKRKLGKQTTALGDLYVTSRFWKKLREARPGGTMAGGEISPKRASTLGEAAEQGWGGPRSSVMGFVEEELGMGSLGSVRRSNWVGAVGC